MATRYVLDFGTANAGGSPAFDLFARLDTLAALTEPTITEISDGEYYFDYDWAAAPSGVTSITYKATLNAVEVAGTISGVPGPTTYSPAAGDLTTLANVKAYLGDTSVSTNPLSASDALLQRLITSVSAWFVRQIGRHVVSDTYTETQIADGWDYVIPKEQPVTAVTSITVDDVAVTAAATHTASGWELVNGVIYFKDYYVPVGSVIDLSYTAGYASNAIPGDIEEAVIEMVALKYRERLHVGNASASALGTSVTFLPSMIPNAVRDVIDGYRRVAV